MELEHVERLSSRPEILKFAQGINRGFLRTGLTELPRLSGEYEAVLLRDAAGISAIVVFYRETDHDQKDYYYLVVVWTSKLKRGQGCYARLLEWLKDYARRKKASRLATDVHHDNEPMIGATRKKWRETFVRFTHEL